jgi:hypothetical protein
MATDAQRARRRAQRATAKAVRENRAKIKARIKPERRLPETTTRKARLAATEYGYRVLDGREPRPAVGSKDGRQLARLASFAHNGKADDAFKAFDIYFYHNKEQNFGPDAETYEEGNTRDSFYEDDIEVE